LAQGLGQSVVQSNRRADPRDPRIDLSAPRNPQACAQNLGITFRHTIEQRIEGAEQVGSHKTSMLHDVELGRSLEIEALVGSVLEIGRITETPAPSIEVVYACVKLLNRTMLLEGSGIRASDAA
jgi:hypothetical protein